MHIVTLAGRSPLSAVGERVAEDLFAAAADVVNAAGGDGTILQALALAAPAQSPVLGVDVGHLGFLAEVEPRSFRARSRRSVQEISASRSGSPSAAESPTKRTPWRCASNDLVLGRMPGQGQAAFAASVDGELFARYVGDGLIVSTPTGSRRTRSPPAGRSWDR